MCCYRPTSWNNPELTATFLWEEMEALQGTFLRPSYLGRGGVRTRVQSQHAQHFRFILYTAKSIRLFVTPMLFVIGDISLEKSECLSLQMRSVFRFHPWNFRVEAEVSRKAHQGGHADIDFLFCWTPVLVISPVSLGRLEERRDKVCSCTVM